MCGHSTYGNRETSVKRLHREEATEAEALGKGKPQNPDVGQTEESDVVIVAKKLMNKGKTNPAESTQRRTTTKRNPEKKAVNRIQSRKITTNGLDRVRQRAEAGRKNRFNNLLNHLNEEQLRESFYQLKRNVASGLDGTTWKQYERKLEVRLPQLKKGSR